MRKLAAALVLLAVVSAEASVLEARGTRLCMDGRPFPMWGARTANALKDDAHTDRLIENLDSYKSFGVNTISVFIQGANGGRDEHAGFNGFTPEGRLRPETKRRLARLIEACDRRGMAVCVGYFYQRKDEFLKDEAAVFNAVRRATGWLTRRGYRNVFVDIVNEFGHEGFDHALLKDPARAKELVAELKRVNASLLCGISDAGVLPQADLVLYHGAFRDFGNVDKPVVNNESWVPRYNDSYEAPGVYTTEAMDFFKKEAERHHARGYYWFQFSRLKQSIPCRFEVGPAGTQPGGEPSDHWMFEHIRALSGRASHGGRGVRGDL